jgi:uncharacterized damage-inducible protein DinB
MNQIAKHFHDIYFGGNWTSVHIREALSDISLEEACFKHISLNSILALSFHISYYTAAVLEVLKGSDLNARDADSYKHPEIKTESDWKEFQEKMFADALQFVQYLENLPSDSMEATFVDPKYGTYFRNIHGLIEHAHYHLGQIVLIKKLYRSGSLS